MADRERYHVRLVRPRFEVSYLTVEAPDEDIAQDMALRSASTDPKDWALIEFNPKDYHAYVERCVTDNDLAANEMTADDAEAEFSSTEAPKHDKYLLMYADTARRGRAMPDAVALG
jgi:hypothetical protein